MLAGKLKYVIIHVAAFCRFKMALGACLRWPLVTQDGLGPEARLAAVALAEVHWLL